jgi:hypothetical protein
MARKTSPAAGGTRKAQSDETIALWPFGAPIALAAVPVIWLALAASLWMTHRWLDWPTSASASGLVYLAAAVGLVPVGLLVLEAVARRGGAVTTRWGGIDFGKGVKAEERPAVEIQTSLGFEGQPINDSSVASVHQTLNAARTNDIVRLDLGTGDSWWMTRLFALCYGAVRADAPKILVFVGRNAGVDHAFLGWIRPRDALRLLRAQRPHLRFALDRAESIARYLTTVAPTVRPARPVPPSKDPQFQPLLQPANAYARNPSIQGLGEETPLRVLLDLLGKYEALPGPEYPRGGERMTTGVLVDVFGTELRRQSIDVAWPDERQLDAFFASTDDQVAILDRERFVRIVPRTLLENALLRQVLRPREPSPQ